jgi:hypothetical protein
MKVGNLLTCLVISRFLGRTLLHWVSHSVGQNPSVSYFPMYQFSICLEELIVTNFNHDNSLWKESDHNPFSCMWTVLCCVFHCIVQKQSVLCKQWFVNSTSMFLSAVGNVDARFFLYVSSTMLSVSTILCYRVVCPTVKWLAISTNLPPCYWQNISTISSNTFTYIWEVPH